MPIDQPSDIDMGLARALINSGVDNVLAEIQDIRTPDLAAAIRSVATSSYHYRRAHTETHSMDAAGRQKRHEEVVYIARDLARERAKTVGRIVDVRRTETGSVFEHDHDGGEVGSGNTALETMAVGSTSGLTTEPIYARAQAWRIPGPGRLSPMISTQTLGD